MLEKMQADRNAELSRQYDVDGSVRPSTDTGYRHNRDDWRSFIKKEQ